MTHSYATLQTYKRRREDDKDGVGEERLQLGFDWNIFCTNGAQYYYYY